MELITNGRIHTAQLLLYERDGIDIHRSFTFDRRGDKPRPRRDTLPKVTIHFNPNKWFRDGGKTYMGACESLADFNVCLDNWLARNSIDRSKCNIRRVDFCMNCYDEEAAERFIGFCDLLIYAFIIRYDVPQKEQNYTLDSFDRRLKSHEAKHRGHDYTIELILYNKAIQQESDGALWRFEIRFMYEDRFKGIADKSSPVEALQILSNNIWDLRQYYYEAISKLTECMIRDFKEYRSAYPAEANCYQYLLINRDRLFLASQVKDFLEGIGHGSPKRGKKWFFEKYGDAFNLAKSKTELTHRGQLIGFSKEIKAAIEKWINGSRTWDTTTANSEDASKDEQAP